LVANVVPTKEEGTTVGAELQRAIVTPMHKALDAVHAPAGGDLSRMSERGRDDGMGRLRPALRQPNIDPTAIVGDITMASRAERRHRRGIGRRIGQRGGAGGASGGAVRL
jgi:hypothetical protein